MAELSLSADGLLASEFKHQSRFGHKRLIPIFSAIRITHVRRLRTMGGKYGKMESIVLSCDPNANA